MALSKTRMGSLSGNEVPITGGNRGKLENCAPEGMEGIGAGGFLDSHLILRFGDNSKVLCQGLKSKSEVFTTLEVHAVILRSD